MSDVTTSKRKAEILDFFKENAKTPSIFTAWEPTNMRYGPHERTRVAGPGELEQKYDRGMFTYSDMFVLKAIHELGFAPCEAIFALVQYFYREEVRLSSEENRPKLCVPNYVYFNDALRNILRLAETGAVTRYDFYPLQPKMNRDASKVESIFKIGSYAVTMYRRILSERNTPYDPREAFSNPEDSFACSLSAIAVASLLKHPCLKSVTFKTSEVCDKKVRKLRNLLVFNQYGLAGGPESDCYVTVEGMTFQTNQNVVTLANRYKVMSDRVDELYAVYKKYLAEGERFFVAFVCEDANGLVKLSEIVMQKAPDMIYGCLFTTGNLLQMQSTIYNPQNLKNCFVCFDSSTGTPQVVGAVGYYFIEMDAPGEKLAE